MGLGASCLELNRDGRGLFIYPSVQPCRLKWMQENSTLPHGFYDSYVNHARAVYVEIVEVEKSQCIRDRYWQSLSPKALGVTRNQM